jgi:hypothetical protein
MNAMHEKRLQPSLTDWPAFSRAGPLQAVPWLGPSEEALGEAAEMLQSLAQQAQQLGVSASWVPLRQ